MSIADVKITMTLANHDIKELDSKERRRCGLGAVNLPWIVRS